ncbi:MAG TPA: ROK family protein [Jatrophihabitans sp.]|nr:ROK family protein [Jatrophihabitans sp.]
MGATADAVIGVDVGGTGIKAALCRPDGSVLAERRTATPVGVPAVLAAVQELIDALAGQAAAHGARLRGVGLGLPGMVDAAAGIARYSANLGWRDLRIQDLVAERVAVPVAIEHDARAAGLAELRLGAARGATEALYLALGTGIGAAPISRGELIAGAGGLSGELGHLPVVTGGEVCPCGQAGCTERYASAAALSRRYQAASPVRPGEPTPAADPTSLVPRCDAPSAKQVIARAAAGDPVAVRVFDEAIEALARALICYTVLLDPALIVVGGGLSLAGARLLDPLAAALADGLTWRPAPVLVAARFGADSGRVGAALLGWRAAGGG